MIIPKHKRQVMPQVGVVPSPIFPTPVRAAFGEQSAKAQESVADTGIQLAGLLEKHAQRKVKAENDRHISELDTQFRISAQDFLFNQNEETYMKDGRKSTRPKGILNRNLSQAEGVIYDFDSWYQKNRDNYLQNIQNAEHGAMLAQSMDSHYMSLRNNVVGHEVKQGRLNIETSLTANINQKISDGFMKQDPLSLNNAIEDIKIPQNALNNFSGYEKEVSELKTRATIDSLAGNAIQGALATDTTGTKATILLNSVKDKIHAEDYKEAENVIKKQMKVNSRLVEDDLLTKELLGELTIEEIFANSQPREQGGIGPAKANTIKNRLLRQQKAQLKDIQEDAEGAEEYVKLVEQVFDNQIDIFNAKKVMVDAFADGVVDKEEVNKIKTIKENMADMKWNKEEHGFINGFKSLVTFGKWQNTSTQELAVQTRELINAVDKQEGPETAAIEILRNKYNSIHSDNPIGKDEDVLKRLGEEFDKALEVKKEENLSFDFNKLNPFAATEASAEEEDTEAPTRKTITKDTIYESLSLQEKLLSGDIGNKIIDIVSGGMTLQEADDFQRATFEGYADLPGDIWNLSISILQDVGEHIESAKGFAMNPIGTINDSLKSKSKEELEALSEKYGKTNEPLLKVVGRIFEPIGRIFGGVRGAVGATGKAIEEKNVAEMLEGGVRGFLKPEEIGTLTSKVSFFEFERGGKTKAGSIARLLPRAIAEAIETIIIAELTLGLPSKIKGLKTRVAEREIIKSVNKIRRSPEMRQDTMDWLYSRGAFNKNASKIKTQQNFDDLTEFALNMIENNLKKNPALMDKLIKQQTFGKMLKDKLASEVGTLKFSPEVAPLKSNLQAVAQFKMPGVVTAQQAIATLTNAGVTKEEIEFSGVEEFVESKGKVTRDELVDYIEKNKVKVETVVRGDSEKYKRKLDLFSSRMIKKYGEEFDPLAEIEDQANILTGKEIKEYESMFDKFHTRRTKYSKYQLPGGKNYQESLLTLPSKGISGYTFSDYLKAKDLKLADLSQAEIQNLRKEHGQQLDYKTSHWNEPNVLAHHRTNQRHDADGNTGTFIEEIQSDWHSEGKRRGYRANKEEIIKLEAQQKQIEKQIEGMGATSEEFELRGKWDEINNKIITIKKNIPDAPFKNTWHELAIKDIIRQAVERGDKFVAFISGEQTVDRYDLSKQIDEVKLVPSSNIAEKTDKEWNLMAYKGDNALISRFVNSDEISDYLGKGVANKLLKVKKDEYGIKTVSGVDLKVGGNWAKKFYDEILPQTASKYIKQWGGKIENIDLGKGITERPRTDATGKMLPRQEETFIQKGFYITPQMTKEISEVGQPLFGRRLEGSLLEKLKSEKGMAEPAGETPLPEDLEGKPEIFDTLEDVSRETIPKFKTTNEAVAFGAKATPSQIKALKAKQKEIADKIAEIKKTPADELSDEQRQVGMNLAAEKGLYREAIDAAEGRIDPEEVKRLTKSLKEVKGEKDKFKELEKIKETLRGVETEELEKHIELRYEQGATQGELDLLEEVYAERISEELPGFLGELEDDFSNIEGIPSIEELLINMYARYIDKDVWGAQGLDKEQMIDNMRSNIEIFVKKNIDSVSDEEILSAAKDLYNTKEALIARREARESDKFKPLVKFEGKGVTALIQKSIKQPGKWELILTQKDGTPPKEIIKDTYKEAMEEAREKTGVLIETSDENFIEHLKSIDKSGLKYSKKIEIEETGETVEVTKDVSEILRENSKTKTAHEQFLGCVLKL